MVKNTKGGKNAKKFGRKFTNQPSSNILRLSKEEGEIYACCSKIYGGPNIEVKCVDGIDRLCVMRNKFRGRGKRDNNIQVGTWLLVGIREFETVKEGKKQTCDLLEVYKEHEKEKLQQNSVNTSWSILKQVRSRADEFNNKNDEESDLDGFEFGDTKTDEIKQMIDNSSTVMVSALNNDDDDDDIDIDDI